MRAGLARLPDLAEAGRPGARLGRGAPAPVRRARPARPAAGRRRRSAAVAGGRPRAVVAGAAPSRAQSRPASTA